MKATSMVHETLAIIILKPKTVGYDDINVIFPQILSSVFIQHYLIIIM